MFTLEQIQSAHARIKNGSEYPKYVQELKALGVLSYTYFVADGHTEFWGAGNYKIASPASLAIRPISEVVNALGFQAQLIANQKGQTTFPEFCDDCAKTGISQWVADLSALTCAYFSLDGALILVEKIPALHSQ